MKKLPSLLLLLLIFTNVEAHVTMPKIFGNNMVIQRNQQIPIWGWATPNEKIVVSLNKQNKLVKADKNGDWMVNLMPESGGGPFILTIEGKNIITFSNVLIGEVWICSGQSNMEWPLEMVINADKEIAEANYPQIRHFTVEKAVSSVPLKDIKGGSWELTEPDNAAHFSAVAYFYARKLYKELNVPIGVINSSWGGSHVETWTSRTAFERSNEFKNMISLMPLVNMDSVTNLEIENVKLNLLKWSKEVLPQNVLKDWTKLTFDDSEWKTLQAPGTWEEQGLNGLDGVLLFRKYFTVSAENAGKSAILELAKIDDNDITYVNGIKVGETNKYDSSRKYEVPKGILKAGKNVVSVRVTDTGGGGGFYSNAAMQITVLNEQQSLSGEWRYGFESINKDIPNLGINPNQYPTLLYNAMISPLIPFSIKGVIWYQGESNTGRAWQYRTAFPLMITDWRNQWGQGDFPFYYVQLASFDSGGSVEKDAGYKWAELRDAQTQTLSLPNTGMAVTTDIGDANDIHPRNKQDVGLRLALIALNKTYDRNLVSNGPIFSSMKIDDNKVIISYNNVGSGLITTDKYGYLKGFEIAGKDKSYRYAKAYIKGDQVIVYSDHVINPIAVRFGWFDEVSDNNLFNKEGLPAAPFATDSWERVTFLEKFKFE